MTSQALATKTFGEGLDTLLTHLSKGCSRNVACAKAGIHPVKLSDFFKKAEHSEDPEIQELALSILAAEADAEAKATAHLWDLMENGPAKTRLDAAKFWLEHRDGWSSARGASKQPTVNFIGRLEQIITAETVDDDPRAALPSPSS